MHVKFAGLEEITVSIRVSVLFFKVNLKRQDCYTQPAFSVVESFSQIAPPLALSLPAGLFCIVSIAETLTLSLEGRSGIVIKDYNV